MVRGLQPAYGMKFHVGLVAAALVGTIQVAQSAELKSGQSGFFGAGLGVSSVNQSVGTGFAFSLNGGYFLKGSDVGIGAFLRSSSHSQDVTSFFFGIEGLYRFTALLPGLSGGVMIGSGKFSLQQTPGDTAFAYGVKAAYDYPLSADPLSVGVDLSLNWVEPGTKLLTVFSPIATVKYWF